MSHCIGIEGGGTKFVCVHGTSPVLRSPIESQEFWVNGKNDDDIDHYAAI